MIEIIIIVDGNGNEDGTEDDGNIDDRLLDIFKSPVSLFILLVLRVFFINYIIINLINIMYN